MAASQAEHAEFPRYSRDLWLGAAFNVASWGVPFLLPTTLGMVLSVELFLASLPFWLRGCIRYAMSKGWHWAVGLLGLFSFIGLLVLWQLPTMRTRRRR